MRHTRRAAVSCALAARAPSPDGRGGLRCLFDVAATERWELRVAGCVGGALLPRSALHDEAVALAPLARLLRRRSGHGAALFEVAGQGVLFLTSLQFFAIL